MRRLALLALLCACKKDAAPTAVVAVGSGSGSGSAIAIDAGGPAMQPLVELLHNAPSEIEVSSRVANKKILPSHLVDGNLATAWNSQTNELLAGAWIYVGVPGANIVELRMTAGHTGKGPKGEDYFTMNPRIKTVTLLHNNDVISTTTLDIARRDLQTIKLATPVDFVRIRIDDVEMGSKKTWRETCVSELEAWGTLKPGTTAKPVTPSVEVGEPIQEVASNLPIGDPDAFCAKLIAPIQKARAEENKQLGKEIERCEKEHPNFQTDMSCMFGADGPGDPTCSLGPDKQIKIGPWLAAGTYEVSNDSIYGALEIQPAVQTAKGWFVVGTPEDCGHFSQDGPCTFSIEDTKVHGDVLDLRYRVSRRGVWNDFTMTCTMADTVTCTDGIAAGSGAPPP